MAYRASNAAYAYDMYDYDMYEAQPQIAPEYEREQQGAPAAYERPHLDVVTGAGREANQAVSPVFAHVAKLACLAAVFIFTVGFARISIASVTTAQLNANSTLTSTLESAHQQSSDLQVMRSVYGSETRIRELATGALGMVVPEGEGTTIDLSSESSKDSAQDSAVQADAVSAGEAADASTSATVAE